jgi:hypothetical protein
MRTGTPESAANRMRPRHRPTGACVNAATVNGGTQDSPTTAPLGALDALCTAGANREPQPFRADAPKTDFTASQLHTGARVRGPPQQERQKPPTNQRSNRKSALSTFRIATQSAQSRPAHVVRSRDKPEARSQSHRSMRSNEESRYARNSRPAESTAAPVARPRTAYVAVAQRKAEVTQPKPSGGDQP